MSRKKTIVPAERQRFVEEFLGRREVASTQELAEHAGVSAVTMRRDLDALAAVGALERTHGGARLITSRTEVDEVFDRRARLQPEEKRRIGAATVGLLRAGEAIGINDGSTVVQVADHIVARRLDAVVATNALNVALALLQSEAVEVTVVGGLLRRASFGTFSPADEVMGSLWFDTVVLGIAGMRPADGIAMHHPFDVIFGQRLIRRAERVIVVADSTKWDVRGHAHLAAWSEVDVLVTDDEPPQPLPRGVQVVVAN